jgi:LEA14-like dessication related protein
MRKAKIGLIFSIVFISTVLTSCFQLQELQIGEIKNIQMKGLNNNLITLQITVPIQNPNPYRLKIKSGDLKVMVNNTEVGKIKQMENLVISGKSSKDYTVRVVVEITNIVGGLASAYKLVQGSNADIRLSGKVKVQSFLYFKTIDVEDYKLTR